MRGYHDLEQGLISDFYILFVQVIQHRGIRYFVDLDGILVHISSEKVVYIE